MNRLKNKLSPGLFLRAALAIVLFGLLSVIYPAALAADAPTYNSENKFIYANGTPIVIKESAAGVTQIFDASNLSKPLFDGMDVSGFSIAGGWDSGSHSGDISITVESGKIKYLYGHTFQYFSSSNTFNGSITININGGNIPSVSGSFEASSVLSVDINIKGGIVGSVFGIAGGSSGRITNDPSLPTVTIHVYPEVSVTDGVSVGVPGLNANTNSTVTYWRFVTYDANGGGGAPIKDYGPKSGTFKSAQNTFSAPDGKQFKCWSTRADDSGVRYKPGDMVPMLNDGVTLYAVWEASSQASGVQTAQPAAAPTPQKTAAPSASPAPKTQTAAPSAPAMPSKESAPTIPDTGASRASGFIPLLLIFASAVILAGKFRRVSS